MVARIATYSGGTEATLADLQAVPLPERTATYTPIGHGDMCHTIHRVAADMLPDMEVDSTQLVLAKEGARCFGITAYRPTGDVDSAGPMIAWRNSYDKSMSAALALGQQVSACTNTQLSGEIFNAYVHTGSVIDRLKRDIVTYLYGARVVFDQLSQDNAALSEVGVNEDAGFRFLGSLVGEKVLRPAEFNVACREWRSPTHEEFEPRNAWSCYNAVTEGLKATPMQSAMQTHVRFHDLARTEWLPAAGATEAEFTEVATIN